MENKNKYIISAYIVIQILFTLFVFSNQRGYQDAWILQDIFVVTTFYVISTIVLLSITHDNRLLTIFASIFIVILNSIPNLKYELFYNVYDSVAHYGNAAELISSGFITHNGIYGTDYYDFPGLHIFAGYVSLSLGIDLNTSFKLISSILYGIIPLMVYLVTNGIFDKKLQKFIVIGSVIPVFTSYKLVGTTFGIFLFFIFFCFFFRGILSGNHKREFTIISLIFAISIMFSHYVTLVVLLLSLLGMLFFSVIFQRIQKGNSSLVSKKSLVGIIASIAILAIFWQVFKANDLFILTSKQIMRPFIGAVNNSLPVPSRFFAIPLLDQLEILFLTYGQYFVIFTLSLIGLVILIREFKKESPVFRSFYLLFIFFWIPSLLLIIVQLVSNIGGLGFNRFFGYLMLSSPFLAGLVLWKVADYSKKKFKRFHFPSFITLAVVASLIVLIQLPAIFPYQPFVPAANVASPDLPSDSYLVSYNLANTVYQVKMLTFADKFSLNNGQIAADTTTHWQAWGFTNSSFYDRILSTSPLGNNSILKESSWSLLLLHYDKAGYFSEPSEYRSHERIELIKDTAGNVVYDNGQSFIISR